MTVKQWILLVLAAGVVAAYFGVLGPVIDVLEQKIATIEKKSEARVDGRTTSGVRARLESLGNDPRLEKKFSNSDDAWIEAMVVLGLFVFVTPIALVMAGVVVFFLLAALASLAPPFVPHNVAMLVLAIVGVIATYVTAPLWSPSVQYYAGWVARAYLIVTSG